MALSKGAKAALVLLGATAILGGAACMDAWASPPPRKRKSKALPGSEPQSTASNPSRAPLPAAPITSPQSRWDTLDKKAAIRDARARAEDVSFGEYWRTVLSYVYPESFDDVDVDQLRLDVEKYLEHVGVNTEWKFSLWLRFDSVIDGCFEACAPHSESICHCVASEIYPDAEWPPGPRSPAWQQDMWDSIAKKVDAYGRRQSRREHRTKRRTRGAK